MYILCLLLFFRPRRVSSDRSKHVEEADRVGTDLSTIVSLMLLPLFLQFQKYISQSLSQLSYFFQGTKLLCNMYLV